MADEREAVTPQVFVQTVWLRCPECGYERYVFLDQYNPDEEQACVRCGVPWYMWRLDKILAVLEDPLHASRRPVTERTLHEPV